MQAALTQSQATLKSALNSITGQGGMAADAFGDDMGADLGGDDMGADLGGDDLGGDDGEEDFGMDSDLPDEEPEEMPVAGAGRAKR